MNIEGIYEFKIKATLEGGSIFIEPCIITIEVQEKPESLEDLINYAPLIETQSDTWNF